MANQKVKDLPIEATPTLNDYLVMDKADGSATEKVLISDIQALLGVAPLTIFKQVLTAAQLKTAFSIPIPSTDLPAPGAGKAWEILSFDALLNYNSQVYTSTQLQCGVNPPYKWQRILANIMTVVTSGIYKSQENDNYDIIMIENTGVVFTTDTDSLTGDSDIVVYGLARLVAI